MPLYIVAADLSASETILSLFVHVCLQRIRLFFTISGSSGDESDSSRGNSYNIDVPVGLQVIPLSPSLDSKSNDNNHVSCQIVSVMF